MMLSRDDIEKLAAHKGEHAVVSLYLNLDPRKRGTDAFQVRLRGLLKEAAEAAEPEDIEAIEQFFENEFDWTGRSVVVFSSVKEDLWMAEGLAAPVRSHVHVGSQPFISSLVDLMDSYGSYTAAIVDRQGAQFYHFHLGELVDTAQATGDEVKRVKHGGGSGAGHMQRGDDQSARAEEAVRANLRNAAEALDKFCARHKSEIILLAGADPTVAQFKALLPQARQKHVIGSFNVPAQASESEVREQSLEQLMAIQRDRRTHLAETIITSAAKQADGVVGLEATLEAIHAGRVLTLAIVEGLHATGHRCESCGYVTVQGGESCALCGGKLADMHDIIEYAVRQAVEQAARIEFLEEDTPLAEYGSIGALLRY
jgi:peptide subunit release factor 1 (eRF1)